MIVHPSISGLPYIYIYIYLLLFLLLTHPPPIPGTGGDCTQYTIPTLQRGLVYQVPPVTLRYIKVLPPVHYPPVYQWLPPDIYQGLPPGIHSTSLVSSRDAYARTASLGRTQRFLEGRIYQECVPRENTEIPEGPQESSGVPPGKPRLTHRDTPRYTKVYPPVYQGLPPGILRVAPRYTKGYPPVR